MKMKTHGLSRLLAVVLVFLLALTTAVPVLAEPSNPGNLKVRIRNNEGLPAMSTNQFDVYQLFIGTPYKEGNAESNDWDAANWNNLSLADIEWGSSVTDKDALVTALQNLTQSADSWAFAGDPAENVFAKVDKDDAASLAEVLADHPENEFLQHFSAYLMANKETLKLTKISLEEGNPTMEGGSTESASDDSLTYTLPSTGYYLFAETGVHTDNDAVSEYMLAVVGEQDILLKASVPTVDKTITDGENESEKGDVEGVGKEVVFDLKGTLPKNFGDFETYFYQFSDTMSKGLSLVKNSFVVTVKQGEKTYTIDPSEYKLTLPGTLLDPPGTNTTILVEFNDLVNGYTANDATPVKGLKYTAVDPADGSETTDEIVLTASAEIHVAYSAIVNTDAIIGVEGNPNTVDLTYSNDPNSDSHGKTKEKTVYVFAFGLDLTKVGSNNLQKGLEGAGFVLKDEDGNYAIFKDQWILKKTDGTTEFYDSEDAANTANTDSDGTVTGPVRRLTGWTSSTDDSATTESVKKLLDDYRAAVKALDNASNDEKEEKQAAVDTAKAAINAYLLESGADGKIPDVYGLDEGSYTLEEVITPDGYNTMEEVTFSIEAEIDENGKLTKVTYKNVNGIVMEYNGENGNGDVIAPNVFSSGLLPDTLINQKAPFLPFTGGIGTLIFYVLGLSMIGGAVTYLVITVKKQKKAEEKPNMN